MAITRPGRAVTTPPGRAVTTRPGQAVTTRPGRGTTRIITAPRDLPGRTLAARCVTRRCTAIVRIRRLMMRVAAVDLTTTAATRRAATSCTPTPARSSSSSRAVAVWTSRVLRVRTL